MSEIRTCDDHGAFEGSRCPVCETAGTQVISAANRTRASKFLSGALRHFPDDVGLDLDAAGWADFERVVQRTLDKYDWLDEAAIKAIVRTDPKGRFEVDGNRIRAAYGHSVDVSLESSNTPVPDVLYHGTVPEALPSIRQEGLKPMSRQHVHLSGSVAAAHEVGRRHASEPVILTVDAAALEADSNEITKRGREVYTTDHVPPTYISRHE
ncbi:MAG: RNA 2'-phosphotransferase [Euryarchaeota archaeon]|nr:RNA 2'-phosphotransferase [Euryarchaeota archaeon]